MKTYTIIAGVNGVGKSSFTGVLLGEINDLGVIIDTDKITSELGKGELAGGKEAVNRIQVSLRKGIDFTQETTLSGTRTVKTIKEAKELGYHIRLYYIGVNSVEESIKRIRNRVEKGGHNIPDEDVRRRYNKRLEDLLSVLPYCNEVKFYDNENGFIEVGEYKNGLLTAKRSSVPEWLKELQNRLSAVD